MKAANCRLQSLLTSFPKVFEKAMYDRLTEHFNINKILIKQQFGFGKNLATEDIIYKLTNEILNVLNNKTIVDSIFCDLEKAFHSVNHEKLLIKL
jgi:hypothetical protein